MSSARIDFPSQSARSTVPHMVFPGEGLIQNHPDPTDISHRYIGKISPADAGGPGTGTLVTLSVDGVGYNIVVTAAHVIFDYIEKKMASQAYFTPAYCPGSAPGMGVHAPSAPFGIYAVGEADMFVPDDYKRLFLDRYDYGALLLRQPLDTGLSTPPLLGSLGLDAGQPVEVYGYPGIADG